MKGSAPFKVPVEAKKDLGKPSLQISKPAEMLLVGSSSSDPFSTIVVDPRTGVATWSYKGSELQGGAGGLVRPLGRAGEHIVISIKDKPLVHVMAVHNRDRFHQKSVVAGPISAMTSSADGTLLFAAIRTQIYVWLLSTGELLSVTDAHYQNVSHIALSEDGSTLFSAANDGAVHVYLVSDLISCDRDLSISPIRKWRAHSLATRGLSVSRGRDPRVATCGLDHIAAVHSVSLDSCLLKVSADRPLTACALDPAESRLFLGTDLGNIVQINLYAMGAVSELLVQTADERNERVPVLNGHSDEIVSLSVNGDGSLLASGDFGGRYCIWDIASRQTLKVSSMRGPVSSLEFVPNWPTLSSAEHISSWKPSFDLQRNPTAGRLIPMTSSNKNAPQLDAWRATSDNLIEKLMFELEADSSNVVPKKAKKMLNQADIPLSGSDKTESSAMEISSFSRSTTKDHRIKELEEEVAKLKKINAKIYQFAAQEILDDK